MSQAPVGTSGLLRVTVASGTRRVDLVLPGAVPVAELVPELARSVGLLDASTVHGGYRLATSAGRRLTDDAGLAAQGVEDGSVITVAARVDDPVPPVYDDVVEAMVDVVEHELEPWAPEAGRRTTLVAASVLLLLGAAALLVESTTTAGAAAAGVAAALVVAAVVLSRVQHEREAAVTVAWLGAAHATTAALVLADAERDLGLRLAAGGGALAVTGLVCLVALAAGRALLVPAVVVGALLGGCGVVVAQSGVRPAVLLSCVTAFVVLVGSVFPWLAVGATATAAGAPTRPGDVPAAVDPARVAADARVAHEILVAITATVGLLLVLTAPLAVDLGLGGTLLAAAGCLVVALRTRHHRARTTVLVGLGSGTAGLAVVVIAVLVLHPSWLPGLAVVLAAGGAVLLALTLTPSTPSLRRGRLDDVVETVALVSMVPLLVLATGLVDVLPA